MSFLIPFIKAGADIISFHSENVKNVNKTIKVIKSYKKKVGLVLNPNIKINKIFPYLDKIDLILVMTVYPGFGGQKFMKSQIKKIEKIHQKIKKEKLNIDIEVDGGINISNAKKVLQAGANILVAGTACFKGGKKFYKKNLYGLRKPK